MSSPTVLSSISVSSSYLSVPDLSGSNLANSFLITEVGVSKPMPSSARMNSFSETVLLLSSSQSLKRSITRPEVRMSVFMRDKRR